ncbi:MAG: lysophospholipid acyltransferase family protein [Gemmatimonadaceae bacterium]
MSDEQPVVNLRHRVQYGALRVIIAILGTLGWERASAFGAKLGALGWSPLGIRRRVVERQIAAAFPGLPHDEVLAIARASYENLGRTSIQAAIMPKIGAEGVLALFDGVENWSAVEKAIAAGKGLIFVTGHLGNWELAGAYVACRGVPLDVVARHMENPLFDRYLTSTRERIGMAVVHDDDAVRRTPRSIRSGRAIAFLSDQGVLGLASTFVPFFGMPAKTPRGPAVFALRLGVPVVFGCALRQPNGRFRMFFEAVTVQDTGNREQDVDAIVAEYTKTLERWVRRAPEQYFWHHRRWRRQPPGTPEELRDPSR